MFTGNPMGEKGHLRRFFTIHLENWEPGHEEGLCTTTQDVLQTEELQETFVKAFQATMNAEDAVWEGLYQEIQQSETLGKYKT